MSLFSVAEHQSVSQQCWLISVADHVAAWLKYAFAACTFTYKTLDPRESEDKPIQITLSVEIGGATAAAMHGGS
jgi:hypothetical protein